ncbi:MAG: HEAT repeat domain-containing protein [Deltaproteobacteria bacterium]|nr:HEAT repeat domain-containing protein [Deltaproteobacteria bacterium]
MTLDELREALADEEEEVRYRALRLSQSGLEADTPGLSALLVEALADPAWRVRKLAGQRLVELEDEDAFDAMVRVMADEDDAAARNAAADALVLAAGAAVPALLRAFGGDDADQAKFVIDVLGDIGDPRAVPRLVEALALEDPNLRAASAEALGKIGGRDSADALIGLLDGDDLLLTVSALESLVRMRMAVPFSVLTPLAERRLLRRPVLRLLTRCEGEQVLETIVEAFSDSSRGTREVAVTAFGEWRRRHDLDRVIAAELLARSDETALVSAVDDALGSSDLAVQNGALEVLASRALPQMLDEVLETAADERLEELALEALLRMGPAVSAELLACAPDLPPAARRVAYGALSRIGDERAVAPLVAALDEGDDSMRAEAARALGELGDARAVGPLSRLLGRANRELARAVVEALAQLARSEREPVLEACRERLGSEEPLRIADVCRLLGEVGTLAELPLLEVTLPHPDARVRQAAISAVGHLAGADALDALRRALADESAEVRSAATRALVEEVGHEAVEALRVAAGDDDAQVASLAIQGLGQLRDLESAELLLERVADGRSAHAPAVALAALEALDRLDAPLLGAALLRGAAHPEAEVVKEAIAIASRSGTPGATEMLLEAARHEAWDVRRAAALGLAELGDADALGPVQELLAAERDEMVAAALESALRSLEARKA